MNLACSLVLIFTVKMKSAFSSCENEPKSLEMLEEILRDSKRLQNSFLSYSPHQSFYRRLLSRAEEKTCSSQLSNCLLRNLWHLLYYLEAERECTFDEMEWTRIKRKIKLAQGEQITGQNQPDVYIIPNFLSKNQCEKLVRTYKDIRQSIATRKLWRFSTMKQLLDAIYKASLSPDEYNISLNAEESCDGGALEGLNIGKKLMKVLKFSSSVIVPRGENYQVDLLEKFIQDAIGLPVTNAYHTQLVNYDAKSGYKAHTDCHHIPNDRMATIIIYLTDVEEVRFRSLVLTMHPLPFVFRLFPNSFVLIIREVRHFSHF
ncbi:uncharacterized protein LOC114521079 [Dendronephthya gigantea]|uniref:uncharacterized protein LOC114521079 n=1 Tax=Dendronephthya gigantea TaxID=151771 RepID=UPI00106D5152|nr:uncharacterized protein LOC114521079 [Dendronephthya gigantea]